MSKLRVFELGKELGLSSKEIMAKLQELGFAMISHMSTLEDREIKLIRKKFAHLKPKKKVEAKKARPKKKKTAEEKETKPKKKTPKKKAAAAKAEETEAKPKKKAKKKAAKPAGKQPRKKAKKPTAKEAREESLAESTETETLEPPTVSVRPPEVKPKKEEEIPAAVAEQVAPKEKAAAKKADDEAPEAKVAEPAKEESKVRKLGPVIISPPPPPEEEAKKPAKKSRRKAAKPKDDTDALLEDETQLLLEEKRRIEQRLRQRERRKRKRLRERERAKKRERKVLQPPPPSERLLRRRARGPRRSVITVDEVMTVDELARHLKLKASALILELMQMDIMATKNQPLELETIQLLAEKHDTDIQVATSPEDLLVETEEEAADKLRPRAPIVTVMGHVDHGKTALLDAIRETRVIEQEAGGITQHIGAYEVELDRGRVTFLDTPGHEAFTAMRAHGAQVTDIVVLVVAADDGIMPQTVEAINHARAADVPIVVAINKVDKPTANVDRVRQQLAETELTPEDWGGQTIAVPVSAITKEGIDNLLEMLLLEADLLELEADPDRPAQGIVLEAKLDKGRGPVATVLVQKGTLRAGDAFIVGTQYGRVRALLNDKGESLAEAGPSTPVEVLGFTWVPEASEVFITVEDEKKARQIADSRTLKARHKEVIPQRRMTLEDLYDQIQAGEIKELNVIIKGDVQGSIIALQDALMKLPTEQVKLNIIHAGVGAITESDIILASASNALLIGFNVRPDAKARITAEKEQIDYRLYRVIYDLIDDVRAAMEGLLDPERREIFLGRAEVLQTFRVSTVGAVAGCRVLEGEIVGSENVRIVRDGVIVFDGKISSLKRYKDFARSAPAGTECGIGLENFNDAKVGDVIESYRVEEVARTL